MDKNMVTYFIISIIIGFILGVIFVYVFSPKTRKYHQIKKELDASLEELNTQRQMMVSHFSHSAEILDSMANEFRRLYEHMAENSNQFIPTQEVSTTFHAKKPQMSDHSTLEANIQPVDYPDNPSGLLKNKENKS